MKNKLLVVQNISHEGPGILAEIIAEYAIEHEIADLTRGIPVPDPANYEGVIVLGGPQSANDSTPQILDELKMIRFALEEETPYLGICLGMQLLVKASGGNIIPCKPGEIGFRAPDGEPFAVALTTDGRKDRLFYGLPEHLRVFQLHGETVSPIQGTTLLGTGRECEWQALRVGRNAWGLQCHFEMTREMFELWLMLDPDLKAMNREELLSEFHLIHEEYRQTGRKLLINFLQAAGLIQT